MALSQVVLHMHLCTDCEPVGDLHVNTEQLLLPLKMAVCIAWYDSGHRNLDLNQFHYVTIMSEVEIPMAETD